MRLIDADALKKAIDECLTDTADWYVFIRIIDSMPTIKQFKSFGVNHGIFDYDAECSALNEE